MSLINTEIQPFKAQAFHNGKFVEITQDSLKGKWSVIVFMPAAFTFNCPTEVEDAADNYAEFQKMGAEVYIVTTDTHFSHKVWHETSPAVGKARFPLVGDPTHQLTRAFGVHIEEEGLALRGTFVINPEGVIKTAEIHSNEIARDVSETLRKLKAAQFTAANPEKAADIYIKVANAKIDRDFLVKIIENPEVQFKIAPQNTFALADFMHRVGVIKNKPASFKDYFFDDAHVASGS